MSIQIQKTYAVENVLTDVTSWTISVSRNDTNAVISSGSMTHASTGTYTYSFNEPQAGLTYTISYVATPVGGNPISFSDVVPGGSQAQINVPAITGDTLIDTYNFLMWQRLWLLASGPMVTYTIHGHNFRKQEYMDYLDRSIMSVRIQIAQVSPFEEVSTCW